MKIQELSSLSGYERITLITKYNSSYKKQSIDPKIFENRSEEQIKYLRRTIGKLRNISCGFIFEKDYTEYPECEFFNFAVFSNYAFTKNGILPYPGSLIEQPAKIIEIFECLFELDAEREADARSKSEKAK